MGRRKPGKPRRERGSRMGIPQQLSLADLEPPGLGYDEWFEVEPGMNPAEIDDPRLGDDAIELMRRFAYLAPLYGGKFPHAALLLDEVIATGHLAVMRSADDVMVIPVQEVAVHQETDADRVRDSIHRLHAVGAFLLVEDAEHGVPVARFVARRPERPGEAWRFADEPGVAARSVCISSAMWRELSADVASTVGFMRSCQVSLLDPDPVEYARHEGVGTVERARELFEAALASGYVDHRGCEACPAAHLCSRPKE